MVVSGVPVARQDHAAVLLRLGIDMLEKAKQIYDPTGWAPTALLRTASVGLWRRRVSPGARRSCARSHRLQRQPLCAADLPIDAFLEPMRKA